MDIQYKIFPLGDVSAGIELGNVIDEQVHEKVIAIRNWIQANAFEGLKDIIIGYSSVAVLYDPLVLKRNNPCSSTVFEFIRQKLEKAFLESIMEKRNGAPPIRIPVCYDDEFANDINFISREKKLSREEIIHLHADNLYRVYMIGFLPGFPYLGKIDERIRIQRKQKPTPVLAGSVGIAGGQTGIYPLACPGGWQIIGRSPLRFFNPESKEPVLLKAGDQVQFYPISKIEFEYVSTHSTSNIS